MKSLNEREHDLSLEIMLGLKDGGESMYIQGLYRATVSNLAKKIFLKSKT